MVYSLTWKKWRFIISAIIVVLVWMQSVICAHGGLRDLLGQNVESQRNQIKHCSLLKSNLLQAVWQLSFFKKYNYLFFVIRIGLLTCRNFRPPLKNAALRFQNCRTNYCLSVLTIIFKNEANSHIWNPKSIEGYIRICTEWSVSSLCGT